MEYEDLAKKIIEYVGGEENIRALTHCLTRLRFQLKNEALAKKPALEKLGEVIGVIQSGGQYQVVIGNHVADVYEDVLGVSNIANGSAIGAETMEQGETIKKISIFAQALDILNNIFSPILGVLAGAGMVKGLASLLIVLGVVEAGTGTYQVLNAVGDALFYFFPIFLGKNAMKKFGGNEVIGMVLGAILVYPALVATMTQEPLYTLFAGTPIESPVYLEFFGLPVIMMNYGSSVIPVIAATALAAPVERWLKKHLHNAVSNMMTPFLTLLIIAPLTLLVVGVIATWMSSLIAQGVFNLYQVSPIVTGLALGAIWQLLVIFGLHWGLVPLMYLNVATLGYDPVLSLTFAASFAQIGSVLGVVLKTKDKTLKTNGLSAFFTGIFGITEPAIYGITLPRKKAFIASCIGSAIGGIILGLCGGTTYSLGGLGVFALPNKINPAGIGWEFYGTIIAISVGFIISLALTVIMTKQDEIDLES